MVMMMMMMMMIVMESMYVCMYATVTCYNVVIMFTVHII